MQETPQTSDRPEDSDGDLLDLLLVLAKHKRLIAGMTAGAAVISLVIALLIPKIYTGTAVLMPPQEDQSGAVALLGQVIGSGAGSGAGIASALGLRNPNDLYVGILKSRTIADQLIERFKLQERYAEDTLVDTRKALEESTTITAGKDGLITIEFEDEDPKQAAAIANAYVEELENLTARLAISDASRRRIFFEKQLANARANLDKADIALKTVQEKTGLIKPDNQAAAIFESVATIRGQIAAKEVELSALGTFSTANNPSFIRAQQELTSLRKQLAGLERDNRIGSGDILVPTGKVPEAGLQFLQKLRDVRYHETVYELLAKQLELARVEEGKNATIIQFVDRAIEPDKKSKPKRALIVLISTFIVGFLSVVSALVIEALERAKLAPAHGPRLHLLRNMLRIR
jgi:tyrosine-protein kinase Etk/Wzc